MLNVGVTIYNPIYCLDISINSYVEIVQPYKHSIILISAVGIISLIPFKLSKKVILVYKVDLNLDILPTIIT